MVKTENGGETGVRGEPGEKYGGAALALGPEAQRGEGRAWRTGLKNQELTREGGRSRSTH